MSGSRPWETSHPERHRGATGLHSGVHTARVRYSRRGRAPGTDNLKGEISPSPLRDCGSLDLEDVAGPLGPGVQAVCSGRVGDVPEYSPCGEGGTSSCPPNPSGSWCPFVSPHPPTPPVPPYRPPPPVPRTRSDTIPPRPRPPPRTRSDTTTPIIPTPDPARHKPRHHGPVPTQYPPTPPPPGLTPTQTTASPHTPDPTRHNSSHVTDYSLKRWVDSFIDLPGPGRRTTSTAPRSPSAGRSG